MAHRETKDPRMLDAARRTADWLLDRLPADHVPYWDFSAPGIPNEPRDSSAAAIASAGLLELSRREPDAERARRYGEGARAILASLSSPAYLAKGTPNRALLLHGTYNKSGGSFDTGLAWGDYYFLEALHRLRPVTALRATATAANRVDLSWSAPTADFEVVGYDLERNGMPLASVGLVASYSDTTVTPGTAYTYTVRPRAAGGRTLEPSPPASATTAASTSRTATFAPNADAYVREASSGSNYGSSSTLRVDAGSDPDVQSYLRFSVSGLTGAVRSARLRLHADTESADGPAVYRTGTSWTESGITWRNRPGTSSAATADKGAIAAGATVDWDVTPLVTGNGTYSLRLAGTSSDGVDFRSRTGSVRPVLRVSTDG
jgi:hypothetical protein